MPESIINFKDDLRKQRDIYEWILEAIESDSGTEKDLAKRIINKELRRINQSLED